MDSDDEMDDEMFWVAVDAVEQNNLPQLEHHKVLLERLPATNPSRVAARSFWFAVISTAAQRNNLVVLQWARCCGSSAASTAFLETGRVSFLHSALFGHVACMNFFAERATRECFLKALRGGLRHPQVLQWLAPRLGRADFAAVGPAAVAVWDQCMLPPRFLTLILASRRRGRSHRLPPELWQFIAEEFAAENAV